MLEYADEVEKSEPAYVMLEESSCEECIETIDRTGEAAPTRRAFAVSVLASVLSVLSFARRAASTNALSGGILCLKVLSGALTVLLLAQVLATVHHSLLY